MRSPSIIHITPRNRAEYWIVTVPGHGSLCRIFTDASEAVAYQRRLRNWPHG